MTEGILQSIVQPAIAGMFAVVAAWVAARTKSGKKRRTSRGGRKDAAFAKSTSGHPSLADGDAAQSKHTLYPKVAFAISVSSVSVAILAIINIFAMSIHISGILAIAASLIAFVAGAVIIWAVPDETGGEMERRFQVKLIRIFTWAVAPIGGIVLSLGLTQIGFSPVAVIAGRTVVLKAPFAVNSYYVPSGFMGDTAHITLNARSSADCKVGPSCMKFQFKPGNLPNEPAWAGVYWQSPPGNWGEMPGRKIEGATKLVFWARGEAGGELVSFKAGGIRGKYADSIEVALDPSPVRLTSLWQHYEIDLKGLDTSSVIGAFSWSIARDGNPHGATFFLDEIRIE